MSLRSARSRGKSSVEKAKEVQKERNERTRAAFSGAGSTRDRENKILESNARSFFPAGKKVRSAGFVDLGRERTVITKRPLLKPRDSVPSGTTQINFLRNNPQLIKTSGATFNRGLNRNIASSRASIRRPDGTVIGINDDNLTLEEIEALQIISGQEGVTQTLSELISSRRRFALLSGATAGEAQQFAVSGANTFRGNSFGETPDLFVNEKGEFGLGKQSQSRVNTQLQQKAVRRNAARLLSAENVIKNQTTSGKAGDLADLKGILERSEGQKDPVSRILVSTDETGSVVSPRNVTLQTENALLTGIDPDTFNVDVQTSGGSEAGRLGTNIPNIEQINDIIRNAASGVLLGSELPSDLVTVQNGIDGETFIDFSPEVPEILQIESAQQISQDLSDAFGGGSAVQRQIEDAILNGEILTLGEIIPNFPEIEDFGSGSGLNALGSALGLDDNSTSLLVVGLLGVGVIITSAVLLKRRK